ncbi:glycoside hydrolase family 15 protein [Acetivibrio clariflavus]|uniref:Glycosyl hydrolase, glucoamylase n=1 Tax=Acetivibrio clariflavus (strain DSM 19732 / NBRC 101661 / EBR45) TaxID=720554 RepID=G8LTS8_ACECE|nr:glycoside hydrolase family 15 protein [Acetivibrio clariflavus]AEV67274.1 glycosyl hydrolase, glucoamylase [Acetivibrio clariflavus DSM 19732]
MMKTYFNDAIIGNSRMLVCLNKKGEVERLFWPHIDYPQHIERFVAGIFDTRYKNSTSWFGEDNWQREQYYIDDTNILKTCLRDSSRGIYVEQLDYVLPDGDVYIRQYEFENIGSEELELGFVQYSSMITTTPDLSSTLFDFDTDSLIHYRHNYYISISSDIQVFQFQLGNNAMGSARYTELIGFDSIGMMPDGAVSWKIGTLKPGEKKNFNLFLCASHTLKGVKKLNTKCKVLNISEQYEKTKKYWFDFLSKAKQIDTGDADINGLYKRSLLVFKLMSDEQTGGLLASAEMDEGFSKCGRYAYCWGRDAAFITSALDAAGLTEAVDKFYNWAVNTQDDNGSWNQRYYMDGNLAPSWGLQIDETGTLIWGVLKHYEVTKDLKFLENMWNTVEKGIDFLINFIDNDTGLPKPSYDLWEERFGEHTYSCAAVYGGIMAGVKIAEILNIRREYVENWYKVAQDIKKAMEANLWKDEAGRFIRSVRTKLNPWGSEHSHYTTVIEVNPKGYRRDVTLEDWTVDVSLLGVAIPFGVFDVNDKRVADTVEAIERVLTVHPVGGIKRYENDNYVGGNPWVLTTLWVALYHIEVGNLEKAKSYFEWAIKSRTYLGLLPEQVSKDTGEPCWVIPLTWSHAMFVLVLNKLIEAGAF